MGNEAFGVDLAALKQAEDGVHAAISELGGMLGMSVGTVRADPVQQGAAWLGGENMAAEGSGLAEGINASADTLGHDGLAAALKSFADKWQWGLHFLVDDGKDAANALKDTRSEYEKAEEKAADAFNTALHLAIGNPAEKDDAWKDKSAGQILGDVGPDYSAGSFVDTTHHLMGKGEGLLGVDTNHDGKVGGAQ